MKQVKVSYYKTAEKKASTSRVYWLTEKQLAKHLTGLDWTMIKKMDITDARVPVLPTQAEQESEGSKDV